MICRAGLVAPPAVTATALVNGGMRPREVLQHYITSFYKVVGILAVLVAVGCTAVAKLAKFLL